MTAVLGIFATMMWLIIQYYLQQEAIAWGWVTARFEGEVQVLLCYILVWLYGFFFVFSLKFPYLIRSLHLCRCDLAEANYVAIAVKRLGHGDTEVTFSHDYMASLKKFFAAFYGFVHKTMTFIYSDRNVFGCERKGEASFVFKPVSSGGTVEGTFYEQDNAAFIGELCVCKFCFVL